MVRKFIKIKDLPVQEFEDLINTFPGTNIHYSVDIVRDIYDPKTNRFVEGIQGFIIVEKTKLGSALYD